MSALDNLRPKTTTMQFVLALLGGLFAPLLVIFLIVKLMMGIQATHIEDSDPAVAGVKVLERIKPVGEVSLVDSSAPRAEKTGEQVVTEGCAVCHASGALGAPKIGDKGAWGPRIAQGYDTLVKHALEGIRQMPARGGNPAWSDNEIAGAVAYMANQSGASFTAPAPAAPVAEAAAAAPAAEAAAAPTVVPGH
jgi:cytochrome c5